MRVFDRDPDESSKAFEAWTVYRDLGAHRSLRKAAELYYGTAANVRQFQRWSKRFGWVERARAFDAEREMLRRGAVEEHLRAQAGDYAAREAAIQERILEIRELAAEQSLKILRWPLAEQRVAREDENGNPTEVVVVPAGWSKATASQLASLAAGGVAGTGPPSREDDEEDLDLDGISEEELIQYIALDEKIRARPGRRRPG
ncbi:MAG: hypothetical protein M3P49_01640 [Actinomycetota bacterium]|nr:hypothetical protein [Actinomycetota bacterium]